MKLFVSFALLVSAIPAFAVQRVAERYTCTAFHPVTGYATITYKERARKKITMRSVMGETEISGGRLTYNTDSVRSYPRAVFTFEVHKRPVSVYMDLMRPLTDGCEGELTEQILSGVTYVPLFGAVPNGTTLFTPFSGFVGNPFLPIPVGFVPTSVVTCRIWFKDAGE